MSKTYIGIDPGKSGAIAFIPPTGDPWTVKNTSTDKDLVDAMRDARGFGAGEELFAVIEKVHAMPSNGVAGMFKFGASFGALQMLCTALSIPFELVTPQTWQREMKCLTKGDKNVTKAKAQELFPSVKVIHANADALLLAEYGKRKGF